MVDLARPSHLVPRLLVVAAALLAATGASAARPRGCGCHRPTHHRLVRHAHVRSEGSFAHVNVIQASRVIAVDPWRSRDVDGRTITPPIPGLIHDHDATADYLGKGGTSVPVLHLPSQRGDIEH